MKVLHFMDLIFCCVKCFLIAVTRGACNPNLHGVITHVSHVGSQHLFGLPLRMNGMHRTQFDLMHLDLRSLVI